MLPAALLLLLLVERLYVLFSRSCLLLSLVGSLVSVVLGLAVANHLNTVLC